MKYKTYKIPTNLHFTKEGYENLKKEQKELLKERPIVLTRLSTMREMGDLSENAGYHSAKQAVAHIDRRLQEIKIYLRFGRIIENKQIEKVDLGSIVTISNDKEDLTYMIVGPTEADPTKGKISNSSPIGNALMEKKVGDKVNVIVPAGKLLFTIKTIKI